MHLTPSCTKSLGNIQHEVMHALGIFHEQSRPDRDVFVELYAENIVSIFRDNFEKLPLMDTYNLGYDLDSVMHYGMNEFAVNKSAPNLLPRAKVRAKMGQRNGISILDAAKLQTAYNCPFDNEETTTAIPSKQTFFKLGESLEKGLATIEIMKERIIAHRKMIHEGKYRRSYNRCNLNRAGAFTSHMYP